MTIRFSPMTMLGLAAVNVVAPTSATANVQASGSVSKTASAAEGRADLARDTPVAGVGYRMGDAWCASALNTRVSRESHAAHNGYAD